MGEKKRQEADKLQRERKPLMENTCWRNRNTQKHAGMLNHSLQPFVINDDSESEWKGCADDDENTVYTFVPVEPDITSATTHEDESDLESVHDADENDDDETDWADSKEEVDDIKVDIRAPFDTELQKFSKSDRNTVVQQEPLASPPASLGSSNSYPVKVNTEPEEWTTAPFFFSCREVPATNHSIICSVTSRLTTAKNEQSMGVKTEGKLRLQGMPRSRRTSRLKRVSRLRKTQS